MRRGLQGLGVQRGALPTLPPGTPAKSEATLQTGSVEGPDKPSPTANTAPVPTQAVCCRETGQLLQTS